MSFYHVLNKELMMSVIASVLMLALYPSARGEDGMPYEPEAPPAQGVEDTLEEAPPPPPPRPIQTLLSHLKAFKPPVFRSGHTLPPLTRWGWSMPYDVRVELVEKWGYALEIGGYLTHEVVDEIEKNPSGVNARIVALAASDPKKYPLFVLTHRPLLKGIEGLPEDFREGYYLKDGNGQLIADPKTGKPSWRTLSPLAPDAIFEWAAKETLAPLLRLRAKTPVAVILNGGEYGLSVAGHGQSFWEQSPAVVAARGQQSWLDFISAQKARQELPIAKAVREAFPDRSLYLWYHFGGIPSWDSASWSYGPALLAVSDYPDQSLYYKHFNTGWDGKQDLLTNFTHSLAQAIPLGKPLSYNWVCGGWKKKTISDDDRYMGFLKCLYAAGQIGAVAGYFSLPEGCDGKDAGASAPPHLKQMTALGHAHALFSHLEEFLRDGDLLPGPLQHSRDPKLPAYEFSDPTKGVRVFVRRLRKQDKWLIAAWAANGEARDIVVSIPELGQMTVNARPAGSVYLASMKAQAGNTPPETAIELLDADPMNPSAKWRTYGK